MRSLFFRIPYKNKYFLAPTPILSQLKNDFLIVLLYLSSPATARYSRARLSADAKIPSPGLLRFDMGTLPERFPRIVMDKCAVLG